MTARPVEAVFFWRYLKSPFRAIYGRFPGNKYTKDFLQCPEAQLDALDRALRRAPAERIDVEYRWPGGSSPGQFQQSAVAGDIRGQLAWWDPAKDAPMPWKLGQPDQNEAITIPGDPSKTTEAQAEDELQKLDDSNREPWIVAVKLRDEGRVLHVRAYLGAPPPQLERRGVNSLPTRIREAIQSLPASVGGAAVEFSGAIRTAALVDRILEVLKRDPNVLLVGPPGTGKTIALEDLRSLYEGGGTAVSFDPAKWEEAWTEVSLPAANERRVASLVFHPSYSYEDFVAGLVPVGGPQISLAARPGPLLCLAHWTADPGRAALLTIDEFNRGPAASIFGDMLAVLDKDKRDDPESGKRGATIARPYPSEKMEVPSGYANATGPDVSESIRLPHSISIVAALNSSDRSVAPLDAALRRRFAILHVAPDYRVLADRLGVTLPDWTVPMAVPAEWSAAIISELALRLLHRLNERVEVILGRDFLLGHALFWDVDVSSSEKAAETLAKAFDERVAATLRMTFLDQDEALAGVLNAGTPPATERPSVSGSGVAYWVVPAPELEAIAGPRLRIQDLTPLDGPSALKALHSLL